MPEASRNKISWGNYITDRELSLEWLQGRSSPFGDDNDEDPDFQDDHIPSDSESDAADNETDDMAEDDDPMNTPTVEFIPESTDSSSTKLSMVLQKTDTKSKNAKPNPKSRFNVGKFITL